MAPTKQPKDDVQKKLRKHLTLKEKLEIIEMKGNGYSFAKIAREKKLSESSIRTIYEQR